MLAIPRDAICMAEIIADVLQGELDVVLVHKPGAPHQPELAIGDVDEAGNVFLSGYGLDILDIDDSYLEAEKHHNCGPAKAASATYAGAWSDRHHDRIVIVVEDRIAWDSSLRIFHTGKSKSLE